MPLPIKVFRIALPHRSNKKKLLNNRLNHNFFLLYQQHSRYKEEQRPTKFSSTKISYESSAAILHIVHESYTQRYSKQYTQRIVKQKIIRHFVIFFASLFLLFHTLIFCVLVYFILVSFLLYAWYSTTREHKEIFSQIAPDYFMFKTWITIFGE